MLDYLKPHLPYDRQLDLMASRGLRYEDRGRALNALKTIGYYRLSAYTYVLRERGASSPQGTRGPRSDSFVPGATLDDAIALYDFDRDLRAVLLDGLQQLEVGLRVKVGYHLGKRDPFGHLTRAVLDPVACSRPAGGAAGTAQDSYENWEVTYDRLVHEARNEDFVRHFTLKYDGSIPVWAATELMTFGALLWLLELLPARDATRISRDLGYGERTLLHRYLKSLNVLRNHCAHNARVWNRATVYPPAKPPVPLTPAVLHHLRQGADQNKLYFPAAICAQLVSVVNPRTNWPRRFKTQVRKFPAVHGMTPLNSMGFPSGWDAEPLWNYEPPR